MLNKSSMFSGEEGPLLLVVMDRVGLSAHREGNAVALANTPTLDRLFTCCPNRAIKAHGLAVGLPSDEDMGNSEVGHNALGSGQIYNQGAKLVNEAIRTGRMFEGETWKLLAGNCIKNKSTLHFLGLFSDGNVHSHLDHLKAMLAQAKKEGIERARLHILLDGRDVGETSALDYVEPFEAFLAGLRDASFDVKIASGGGRMAITMDRYESDWEMVRRGWQIHVLGEGRGFSSATEAVTTYRKELNVTDQFLPGFVLRKNNRPIGLIEDHDSVIFFNFRGDRAIEISRAFEAEDFDKFDRESAPRVIYAGMLEYDGDLHIPSRYLVSPPSIVNTLGENLSEAGITQYALSETQKFGHVTYFWNGNNSGKLKGETYAEIPSDKVSFEQRPWMKSAEITDSLIDALKSGKFQFLRANYPNGDMVGHTGDLDAAVIAIEAVDLCLARLLPVIDSLRGTAIIISDHGNSEEMYESQKGVVSIDERTGKPKPKTSHTLNRAPFIIYDQRVGRNYRLAEGDFGLANVTATVVNLLGYEAPEGWERSMIE
ncbi:MAG: 2,3-bisphosphoglycerate-independent phosphoglycerate mutase [Syntrophaceae bacterium]|nr:2,3-bisphosphoglycerate-independent phosphoglycerate mutase [Syntrophaceae bacterium]